MITLAVTAYNESQRGNFQWIRECVGPASMSPVVREIVVVNDGTDDFDALTKALADIPKVRLFQNETRLHVFGNKLESVYRATSDWVLLGDSDNVMRADYFNRLVAQQPWDLRDWYCASFARPAFDYRKLIGVWDLRDTHRMAAIKAFWCFGNTGNQFTHRGRWMETFGHLRGKRFDLEQPDYFEAANRNDEKWLLAYGAQDSFFLFKQWLISGNRVHCVDGMEYDHRMDTGLLSNFNRGPAEKEALAPIYYLEMRDAARGRKHHYTTQTRKAGVGTYRRDDGKIVSVDLHTGIISE